jgi:PKD domain
MQGDFQHSHAPIRYGRTMWRGIGAVLAAAALAGPATAAAAPGWVPGFDEVAPSGPSSSVWGKVAVVTPDLRTVAFWSDYPRVRAAVRPRGGTFGEPFVFDAGNSNYVPGSLGAIALPDGEVLAAWSGGINEEMRIKSLQPDGTVADARPAEPGGSYPALAANDAGMVAVAYYSGANQLYLAIRPAGADTFEPPILLLTLVGNEQAGSIANVQSDPLDITVRDDGQVAVAIGTSVLNPPGGTARMLIARYAGGTTSIETVDSAALNLTPPPGPPAGAEFRGAIELLPDGRQLLVYRLETISSGGFFNRKLLGGPRDGSGVPAAVLLDEAPGPFAGPKELGLSVDDAGRPWLWWRHGINSSEEELRVRQATAAGAFSAPAQVLASPEFGSVDLSGFGDGRTGVLFTQDGKVKASTSDGGAAFGAPIDVATPSAVPSIFESVALAGGGEGSAVALWPDGATVQTSALHATTFDATPPTLQGLQAPESLTAGVPGTFTATAVDDWSVPGVSWLFGDGAMLTGSTVQRAFPSAGSFTATATATDAVGNTAMGARTVTVTTPPVHSLPSNALPSNAITLGRLKLNKKKGTAKLPITVPGPGTLVLVGKGVVRQTKTPKGAVTVKMLIKATGKKTKKLNATDKAKVKVQVTYTPTGGTANTKSRSLVLKKLLG